MEEYDKIVICTFIIFQLTVYQWQNKQRVAYT